MQLLISETIVSVDQSVSVFISYLTVLERIPISNDLEWTISSFIINRDCSTSQVEFLECILFNITQMTDSLKINTLSHQAAKAFCQYYIFKKCFFFLVHEAYNLDPKRKYATVYLIEESHRNNISQLHRNSRVLTGINQLWLLLIRHLYWDKNHWLWMKKKQTSRPL